MTVYCYDTEFLDDGSTIDFISIGIVAADDSRREYYAVNADCDFDRIKEHDWLWENVVPHLPTTKRKWEELNLGRMITRLDKTAACVKPKWVIRNEVRDFLLHDTIVDDNGITRPPELWAYYGAYDHVALAQLFGPMSEMPAGLPYWTHDLMHLWEQHPDVEKPRQFGEKHDALMDARWNLRFYRALQGGES